MKKNIILLFSLFSLLLISSCDTESEVSFLEVAEDIGFTGSQDDIIEFLSQDGLDGLLDLGINVNQGSNPPNVEGVFLASPYVLKASNIVDEGFEIGDVFGDQILEFFNQDFENATLSYSSTQGGSVEQSSNTKISGSGQNFTIFIRATSQTNGSEGNVINSTIGIAISGIVSDSGINDFEYAFIIIEKENDINDDIIDIGEGRSFEDLDGLVTRI